MGGCGSPVMRSMTSKGVSSASREKGERPVSISYSTTPRQKTSERGSTGCPVTCSGDMYFGEPSATPAWVMVEVGTQAMPKSVSLACPESETTMFAGFTSRCTIELRCAWCSASATCAATPPAISGASGADSSSFSGRPARSSIAM
jgi:hypothetical protein